MSTEKVLKEVEKDRVFYRHSNGGITVSGGEPMYHHEFVFALFKLCKSRGISAAMETSGYALWKHYEAVLPYTDVILFDLKHMDSQKHKEAVGVDNKLILENLNRLDGSDIPLIIRVPTIPGFNDHTGNMSRLVELVKTLKNVTEVHLLPFHSLGQSKYRGIGVNYKASEVEPPATASMQDLMSVFSEAAIKTAIEV
jgi:pyruvate formate lyase activating enzyme